MMKFLPALLMGALLLGGCAGVPEDQLYCQHSSYSESLYLYLRDDPDLSRQRELMDRYFEAARSEGTRVAPGAYAHMGMICAKAGNPGEAERYFALEKQYFPESAHFIEKAGKARQGGAAR